MMHMTFYWGTKLTLLFDSWTTNTYTTYLFTLLTLFIFSALYQYVEDRRLRFKSKFTAPSQPSIAVPLLGGCRRFSPAKLVVAFLFGVNAGIGYLLMLAVMSFNGGVFLSVVFGLSFGYFLFRSGDVDDEEEAVVVENPCACA